MEEKIFQLFPKSVIPGDKNSTFPILQIVRVAYEVKQTDMMYQIYSGYPARRFWPHVLFSKEKQIFINPISPNSISTSSVALSNSLYGKSPINIVVIDSHQLSSNGTCRPTNGPKKKEQKKEIGPYCPNHSGFIRKAPIHRPMEYCLFLTQTKTSTKPHFFTFLRPIWNQSPFFFVNYPSSSHHLERNGLHKGWGRP
jgi:hypothetical protein